MNHLQVLPAHYLFATNFSLFRFNELVCLCICMCMPPLWLFSAHFFSTLNVVFTLRYACVSVATTGDAIPALRFVLF